MKTVAIIQARMGSTRLPGKVLKPLAGKTVLGWVVERVKVSALIDEIVVATTIDPSDDDIVKEMRKNDIVTYRGSVEDVLGRYYECAQWRDADVIVRLTSDCPLLDPGVIDMVVKTREKEKVDYCSNTLERSFPHGADVEVFTFESLEKAFLHGHSPSEREHVTPYIWGHPDLFKLTNVAASPELCRPDIRITVDTEADYMFMRAAYDHLGRRVFPLSEVIELVDNYPWLTWINKDVRQKKVFHYGSDLENEAAQYLEAAELCLFHDIPIAAKYNLDKANLILGQGYDLSEQLIKLRRVLSSKINRLP